MVAGKQGKKNQGGRPTKYRKALVDLAFWMARAGMTDVEIAEEIGIHEATLYRWKEKYPEFCEAIKKGKEDPDDRVEQSLFKRAMGYEYEEAKVVAVDGRVSRVEKTKRHIASDVTACIFWLKNRRPEKWRDRHEFEGDLSIKGPLIIREYEEGN